MAGKTAANPGASAYGRQDDGHREEGTGHMEDCQSIS